MTRYAPRWGLCPQTPGDFPLFANSMMLRRARQRPFVVTPEGVSGDVRSRKCQVGRRKGWPPRVFGFQLQSSHFQLQTFPFPSHAIGPRRQMPGVCGAEPPTGTEVRKTRRSGKMPGIPTASPVVGYGSISEHAKAPGAIFRVSMTTE